MTDTERINALIAYLQVLVTVNNGTTVKVFSEMQRTIAEIERLLK